MLYPNSSDKKIIFIISATSSGEKKNKNLREFHIFYFIIWNSVSLHSSLCKVVIHTCVSCFQINLNLQNIGNKLKKKNMLKKKLNKIFQSEFLWLFNCSRKKKFVRRIYKSLCLSHFILFFSFYLFRVSVNFYYSCFLFPLLLFYPPQFKVLIFFFL